MHQLVIKKNFDNRTMHGTNAKKMRDGYLCCVSPCAGGLATEHFSYTYNKPSIIRVGIIRLAAYLCTKASY